MKPEWNRNKSILENVSLALAPVAQATKLAGYILNLSYSKIRIPDRNAVLLHVHDQESVILYHGWVAVYNLLGERLNFNTVTSSTADRLIREQGSIASVPVYGSRPHIYGWSPPLHIYKNRNNMCHWNT